jgi:hypothetical protein
MMPGDGTNPGILDLPRAPKITESFAIDAGFLHHFDRNISDVE